MVSTTEKTSTIYYSGRNKTMVSGLLEQQDGRKHNKASTDNNTTQDNSSIENGEQYSVGDMCMVAQIYRYLQFYTARIQLISGNDILVIYLSTNEKDIIRLGPQVRSLEHVGRGIASRRVRIPTAHGSKKGLLNKYGTGQGNSPEVII